MSNLIKRLKAGLGNIPRKNTVLTPWGQTIEDAIHEIEQLRVTVRALGIQRHVRVVSNDEEIPNGGSCRLCNTEWRVDQPEGHRAYCLLAQGR